MALTNWGHSWVVLGVIVKFPFRPDRYFCLPILLLLYISKQTVAKKGGRDRTRPELAVEMLEILCKRYPNRRFHAVADSTYGGKSVYLPAAGGPTHCNLTSPLDLDAPLYEARPACKAGTSGRPRKRGQRLPTPRQMPKGRGRRVRETSGRRS